jgi:hypothetical protein
MMAKLGRTVLALTLTLVHVQAYAKVDEDEYAKGEWRRSLNGPDSCWTGR